MWVLEAKCVPGFMDGDKGQKLNERVPTVCWVDDPVVVIDSLIAVVGEERVGD